MSEPPGFSSRDRRQAFDFWWSKQSARFAPRALEALKAEAPVSDAFRELLWAGWEAGMAFAEQFRWTEGHVWHCEVCGIPTESRQRCGDGPWMCEDCAMGRTLHREAYDKAARSTGGGSS